ncbi:hypothetical protein BYT27DRAFT_7119585, partial [Phlegmacium glaucopus]
MTNRFIEHRLNDLTENPENERGHLITMASGVFSLKDQLHEYAFRGREIDQINLLTFVLDTYNRKIKPAEGELEKLDEESMRPVGRPPNQRVVYRDGFDRPGHCRILRTEGHETLPHFVGGWMPRSDKPLHREMYCACMLALLKPWGDLADLKSDVEMFDDSFKRF